MSTRELFRISTRGERVGQGCMEGVLTRAVPSVGRSESEQRAAPRTGRSANATREATMTTGSNKAKLTETLPIVQQARPSVGVQPVRTQLTLNPIHEAPAASHAAPSQEPCSDASGATDHDGFKETTSLYYLCTQHFSVQK